MKRLEFIAGEISLSFFEFRSRVFGIEYAVKLHERYISFFVIRDL